jgi:hypothetical protein
MKKYVKLIILIIIIILIIFLLIIFKCSKKEKNIPIIFKDETFFLMIKKELNKEKIYASYLSEISGIMIASDEILGLSGGGHTDKSVILFGYDEFEYENKRYKKEGTIKTLEDLKYFPKLTSIRIYLQPNIDFATIPNKEKIYNLGLSQNKINSLEF